MNCHLPIARHRHRRTGGWFRALIGLALCIVVGLTGCSMFKLDTDQSGSDIVKQALAKAKKQIQTGGKPERIATGSHEKVRLAGGLTLGETDNAAFTPEALADVLSELIEAEKWNSVRNLVALYPDVVTGVFMESAGSLSNSQRTELAKLFDQQWKGTGNDRWETFVSSTRAVTKGKSFINQRLEFLSLVENNQIEDALDLKLSRQYANSNSIIVQAEAARLEGIAHLMTGDHRQSISSLKQAMSLLESAHPYQASQIGLLLGEAYRHAGQDDAWNASWKKAVNIQSRWLAERGLSDPAFWNNAAFLRPVSADWPVAAIRRLEHSLRNENLEIGSNQATESEAVIWAIIGTQSLKRHESQNAILAFKKSEALVSSISLKEELQMQQALAMIDGGQQGPASAILLRLGSKPTLLGDRSKAILATLKLQNGSLAQGMNLLQSAIKTSSQWPTKERLRAQADYGLAYLMRGKEEQGIALLNQVHDEFVKEKSVDHAAQCLANIATYYQKTDQPAEHRLAVARMKQMEVY